VPDSTRGFRTLRTTAYAVIVVVGSWYLLGQLKAVLRPLLMAVFVAYVLMPYYGRLRKKLPAMLALALLGGLVVGVFAVVAAAVTSNLIDLTDRAPELRGRAVELIRDMTTRVRTLPFVPKETDGGPPPEQVLTERLADEALSLLNVVAVGIPEVLATGLYLMFLLLESARFPERVRKAYPAERAEHILDVFGRINAAIISYLKAKVYSSAVVAIPVGVMLAVGGVRFAVLWAVLTFAFLQFGPSAPPVVLAVLLAAVHLVSASVVEPMLLGRAVNMSPLVILAALTLWGVLWGLPGMFLAVPLTVVLRIVLENLEITRPVARLLGGE
jgi:AI-2 transport protein TqsA